MSLSTTSKWFLNTSRNGDSTTSLGSLFQCFTALFVKQPFPDIQPKLTLVQLEAISPCPVTCPQWEEPHPTLAVSTFQILQEGNKVSRQPPFPQIKQPQFSDRTRSLTDQADFTFFIKNVSMIPALSSQMPVFLIQNAVDQPYNMP